MANDLQVRLAGIEEAGIIAEIIRQAFGPLENDYTPESFAIVTPPTEEIALRFDEGPIWVALKDGEIVATVSVVPEPEWLYIRSMAVSPSVQGLGVGGKLLEAVEVYAIENGFERLFLYTTNFSANAIRLYERNGFELNRFTTAEEWFGTAGRAMEKKIGRNIKQNVVGS